MPFYVFSMLKRVSALTVLNPRSTRRL